MCECAKIVTETVIVNRFPETILFRCGLRRFRIRNSTLPLKIIHTLTQTKRNKARIKETKRRIKKAFPAAMATVELVTKYVLIEEPLRRA